VKRFGVLRTLAYMLVASLGLVPAIPALALDAADRKSVIYSHEFYDPKDYDAACGDGTGSGTVSGRDNREKAFNFFVSKGLEPYQAAGVIGNLMQESGLNPRAVQSGGAGRGIAQWSVGGRWDRDHEANLAWHAGVKQGGADIYKIETQLNFIWFELTSVSPWKNALPPLRSSRDIVEATVVFEEEFEKAGTPNMAARIQYAREALEEFGNGAPSSGAGSGNLGAGTACTGGLGVNGDFTFPLVTSQAALKDNSPRWCYTNQSNCHHDYRAADIFIPENTAVVAAMSGTVMRAVDKSCNTGDKYDVPRVQIKGDDGKYYYYTHMKPGSIKVEEDQKITGGSALGVVGPTECAQGTPTHLHFQASNVPIANTQSAAERSQYINVQPALIAAFKQLPPQ
jgi:hypothetical protein